MAIDIAELPDEELVLPQDELDASVGPGETMLYETRTGEGRMVKDWYLADARGKRHDDPQFPTLLGKPVFSVSPGRFDLQSGSWLAGAEPLRGHHPCLLHQDSPDRSLYDSWGLPVCNTSSMTSEYEVRRHMANRHKSEWGTIQAHQAEIEKVEQRALQQAQLEAMQAMSRMVNPPAAQVTAIAPRPGAATRERPTPAPRHCEDCDYVTPEGHGAPQLALAKHRKDAHGG